MILLHTINITIFITNSSMYNAFLIIIGLECNNNMNFNYSVKGAAAKGCLAE